MSGVSVRLPLRGQRAGDVFRNTLDRRAAHRSLKLVGRNRRFTPAKRKRARHSARAQGRHVAQIANALVQP